jgi:hypothetical protein
MKKNINKNNLNQKFLKAFTMLEISIVFLIVAILIGGIYQGLDMYYDMRLNVARSITTKSPINATPNLTLWLETTSKNRFLEKTLINNQNISQWNDINPQKVAKLNFTQSTVGNQPKYVERSINNLPSLRFDNQQMLTINNLKISELVKSNQATIFLVQNSFSGDTTTSAFGWSDSMKTVRLLTHTGNGAITFDFGICCPTSSRLSTSTIPKFLDRATIITYRKNISKNDIIVNLKEKTASSSVSTDSIPGELTGTFAIGKYPPDDNYWFKGLIGEFVIFDRALTDNEKLKIEEYLSEKWAIKLTY